MKVTIYTDGACSGNPGPGGYAFLVLNNNDNCLLKVKGHDDKATNNKMELKAIVQGIKHAIQLKHDFNFLTKQTELCFVIKSDSAYCVNAVKQGWLKAWKANGWKTKDEKEIKNKELWIELDELLNNKHISFIFCKVKGHSGDKWNEIVDKAAKSAVKNLNVEKTFPSIGG